jgi:hypothetical protein
LPCTAINWTPAIELVSDNTQKPGSQTILTIAVSFACNFASAVYYFSSNQVNCGGLLPIRVSAAKMQALHTRAFTCQRPISRTSLNVVCKESRIGLKPVAIPKGVTIDLKGQHLKVKVRFSMLVRNISAVIN